MRLTNAHILNQKTKYMKELFMIYKEGTTDNWVTILIPIEFYTLELYKFKMEKYLELGYQIKPI